MTDKKEVVKVESGQQAALTKMGDFDNVEESLAYAEWLIKSKLINFRKPEEALMAFNMGRAVGLDPAIAATNLYAIEGKITFSVHLAAALAKRAGVDWAIEKDGEYHYNDDGEQIPPYMTTQIRFFRYNPKLDRVIENLFTYTWQDAQTAGYHTKPNWVKMPKNMLRARCLIEGIRFVAPDVLNGIFYEATELTDAKDLNATVELDDNGNPILSAQTV